MTSLVPSTDHIAVVRGGGDLATGIVQKLWRAGLAVVILETARPLAIRRTVSLCSAVYEGEYSVEDLTAVCIQTPDECYPTWQQGKIPLLIDPDGQSIPTLRPLFVIDAILAKKNLGTHRHMAPITIALGPGFSAPEDVDVVIETMRGHDLGRLILDGSALPNTGIPGNLGGKTAERVVHAPVAGIVHHHHTIGDVVEKNEILFYIDNTPIFSPLQGVLRGLIADGMNIPQGLKCADVDPRPKEQVNCYQISDKARALGGATLEACFFVARQKKALSFL